MMPNWHHRTSEMRVGSKNKEINGELKNRRRRTKNLCDRIMGCVSAREYEISMGEGCSLPKSANRLLIHVDIP